MTPFDIPVAAGILLFLATIAAMEGVAIAAHKYVMHGCGWRLHKSHHRPRHGWFEANDCYAVLGAAIAIALFWLGGAAGRGTFWLWLAGGITAYGAIYFAVHDVLVHQRIPHRFVPRHPYLRHMLQAHRLHHAVESRDGTVSFGFLWAPPIARLKQQLTANIARGTARLRTADTA